MQHREDAATPILPSLKSIPHDESEIWYVGCTINKCADIVFWGVAIGCRHFDWLDNLREHIVVNAIIRMQFMSESDADQRDLEWAGVMEECKMELPYVCQKIAKAVG